MGAMDDIDILSFWGKARPSDDTGGPRWHPLAAQSQKHDSDVGGTPSRDFDVLIQRGHSNG